jgi:hypothetical protein
VALKEHRECTLIVRHREPAQQVPVGDSGLRPGGFRLNHAPNNVDYAISHPGTPTGPKSNLIMCAGPANGINPA